MKALWLALVVALGSVGPALAQFGPWYGAYSATLGQGDFEIVIELDQLPGGTTGMASIGLFPLTGRCPTGAMSQTLCTEIDRAIARVERQGGNIASWISVQGVVFAGSKAAIAYAFPGETTVRLAELALEGNGAALRLLHPERRIEAETRLARSAHSCDYSMCGADRLDALARDPQSFAGPLGALAFQRFFPDLDLAENTPAPTPVAPPVPPTGSGGVTLWDVSAIADGRPLGVLYLSGTGRALGGQGVLNSIGFGPDTEVAIAPDRSRNDGFSLNVTFFADGSGEQRDGLLLLGSPVRDGVVEGTLVEDTHVEVVRMIRDDTFAPDPAPDGGRDFLGPDEADETFDMPGIGVYGPSYVLRNIPAGQRLAVRDRPDRSGPTIGSLQRDARGIHVLGCTPEVNSLDFEQADQAGRRRLLDQVWCRIDHPDIGGYVLGGYLEPISHGEGL